VIRVLLADDQALVRGGLRRLLEADCGIDVVGEAPNGREALRLARMLTPDVILMDIRMPVLDGLAALEAIASDESLSAVKIVVLTTYELDEYLYRALSLGASGFLLKTIEPADLRRAIHIVAEGHALIDPTVTRKVIALFGRQGTRSAGIVAQLDSLTEREREVVALVAAGLTNEEIGVELFISPHTVKTHVNRAMTKVDARDRAQLVVVAYRGGLVQ
jgi:DNA-binding NarL/FixJ family response regulator